VLAFKRAAVAELSSVAISWDFAIRLKFPVGIFASAYKRIDERLNSFTSGAPQEGISSCFGRTKKIAENVPSGRVRSSRTSAAQTPA